MSYILDEATSFLEASNFLRTNSSNSDILDELKKDYDFDTIVNGYSVATRELFLKATDLNSFHDELHVILTGRLYLHDSGEKYKIFWSDNKDILVEDFPKNILMSLLDLRFLQSLKYFNNYIILSYF